jgi:hypothetical protein
MKVGRSVEAKPGTQIAPVQGERLRCLRHRGLPQDVFGASLKQVNIGRQGNRQGIPVNDERVRQVASEVAQMPAQAIPRLCRVGKEQLRDSAPRLRLLGHG